MLGRLLAVGLALLPLAAGPAQEQATESPCRPTYSDPEEYAKHLREHEVTLGRGITVRLDFDCGKAQIEGRSHRPLSVEEWKNLRPWLLRQVEEVKPIGKLEEEGMERSLVILNGMYYQVDRYDHGYLQYRMDYKAEERPPTITDFVIYYPHRVSGLVTGLQPAHPSTWTRGKEGLGIELEVRYFSVVLENGDTFFVSPEEFVKLKKGTKTEFTGSGPIEQPVV